MLQFHLLVFFIGKLQRCGGFSHSRKENCSPDFFSDTQSEVCVTKCPAVIKRHDNIHKDGLAKFAAIKKGNLATGILNT